MSAEQQQSEHEGRVGSLYRRHRPRTFADVVGQEPVVRTLRNAVERGKVHHAYLFVGSRGTGKTSMAKILAACLNCENGPTIEPCGVCDSCRSIASATSLDVIEMDAASNNSVDDIRELRESVAYAPVSGRRKVYILDEAHMLSTAAWNAFLKTLEEPPPNTVFVLATTEAAKVPATVIDRCHRFDFHRPTVEQIVSVLARAAAAEPIEIPPPALAAIARSATGSFRDALGTLEQLVTYSGAAISLEDVLAVLGVADARLLAEAIDAVAAGDAPAALGTLERCAAQGRDAASFATDLEARLRELMIVQALGGVPAELALTPESDEALAEQAGRLPHAVVVRLLELLGEALEAIRAGADARTRLELALVKASRPEVDSTLRALLARIERLEQGGTVAAVTPNREIEVPQRPEATPHPAGGPAQSAATGPSPSAAPGPASAGATTAPADPETPPVGPAPPAASASAPQPPPPQQPSAATPASQQPPAATPASQSVPLAAGTPATVAGALAAEGRTIVQSAPAEPGAAPETPAAETPAAETPAAETPAAAGLRDLASVASVWPAVVDVVRAENALLGALIAEARPVEAQGEELTLAFASTFLKKKAEDPANRMTVAEALRVVTGARWRLAYELREDLPDQPSAVAPAEGESEERWLARFMEEFDAEEIPAEPGGGEPAVTSNEKGA
ncbi:MAG TPA: DNA polymerase III subunit gamma/tau [Solirubrobacteraceae bacterium]|nr:DNA polymerase III subunit gamma/tau [Solirubrobacteraceae bacterium]